MVTAPNAICNDMYEKDKNQPFYGGTGRNYSAGFSESFGENYDTKRCNMVAEAIYKDLNEEFA